MDEAVATTLQLESHHHPTSMKVTQVASDECPSTQPGVMVGGVGGGNELPSVSSMLQTILTCLDKLEKTNSAPDHRRGTESSDIQTKKAQSEERDRSDQPVICYRCGKQGHYARGCAESRTRNQAPGKG